MQILINDLHLRIHLHLANLHYQSPNIDIPGLTDGRLKVVTEKTQYVFIFISLTKKIKIMNSIFFLYVRLPNDLLAINSFGFGGANVHAVLKANVNYQNVPDLSSSTPRLAVACARTTDGCDHVLNQLKIAGNNIELQALLNENVSHPAHTHPYRGFTLLNSSETTTHIKVIHMKFIFICDY